MRTSGRVKTQEAPPFRGKDCAPWGERCDIHHTHHYQCADCGIDCTANTPNGPATTQTDGVTRCWKCNRIAEEKSVRLEHAAPAMYEALSAIVDCFFVGSQTPEQFVARVGDFMHDGRIALQKAGRKTR